jgi:hypothetical protein
LFSNPWSSKVSIKICVAASSGGAIIADDTKALTLAGWKIVEGRRKGRSPPILPFARYLLVQATPATGLPRSPLKKVI